MQECYENKSSNICAESCSNYRSEFLELSLASNTLKMFLEDNVSWFRVTSVKEIFEVLVGVEDNSYMIIHGNTAHGKYNVFTGFTYMS